LAATSEVALSVRGESEHTVAPDFAVVRGALTAVADTKADALAMVTDAQGRFTALLAQLGGVPLTVDTERSPLTWSSHTMRTSDEVDYEHGKGRTGRIIAGLSVAVQVRDLTLLPDVGRALTGVPELQMYQVSWHVDADNPAWPAVRAAAIKAAIGKGRDYAAALGGALERIEHVADVGLLGSGETGSHQTRALSVAGAAGFDDGGGSPTLDPVPQQIVAIIEARFVASVPSLNR
jgi:uncharacterized protein YggE